MRVKLSGFLTLAFILFMGITAFGQATPLGYNPFVPKNLDDTSKISIVPVVESSYHRYWIKGDPNYKDTSTYVWYVENGTFVTYDTIMYVWVKMITQPFGKGFTIELPGEKIDSTENASQIWVRWNDVTADSIGYVAVYERSPDSCVVEDQITGFKHPIVAPPEVWFRNGKNEQCADQNYSATLMFNNIYDFSFPYKLNYTYPGANGLLLPGILRLKSRAELDTLLMYNLELNAVHDLDVTRDIEYTVTLDSLSDKFGSTGIIAPKGLPDQYKKLILTIFHLPQTGGMKMDK
jgi:hypothetical protein